MYAESSGCLRSKAFHEKNERVEGFVFVALLPVVSHAFEVAHHVGDVGHLELVLAAELAGAFDGRLLRTDGQRGGGVS